jgi:tetraacyldisaccharide 4'-kinase
VLAFAGIGHPPKFFDTVRACGAVIEAERAFADHHPFSAADIASLREEAKRRGLLLVTTEKDAVRLGASDLAGSVVALPVRLRVEEDRLRGLIALALRRARQPT